MVKNVFTIVPGFKASGVACGIKASGARDLAVILSETPCTAAAVFTQNQFQAAPVVYDRALMERTQGRGFRAILVNAGNANACTGQTGDKNAEDMSRWLEDMAEIPRDSVFLMSTGIIGHPLPMPAIRTGLVNAVKKLDKNGFHDAAEAIMTTDTTSKEASVEVELSTGDTISIGGMAKGSGMIHPNMATMLGALVTDAKVAPNDLQSALTTAVNRSFNRISVDGDTSTNDTVVLFAQSKSSQQELSGEDLSIFTRALTDVCINLAKAIVRDGEGATKLVQVQVYGAENHEDALKAARTLATSPLAKTAIFGNDPNWGRFLAAIGRSGARVDPQHTNLWLDIPAVQSRIQLVAQGSPLPFDATALNQQLQSAKEVVIRTDLGLGRGESNYWTCDFSYKYVEINAEYHT